ncbi:MAG: hypothetical protein R2783_04325 [Gelidibacter sp.]
MKKAKNKVDERLIMRLSEIPLESNLGLLAYGDVAFTAWRKLKKESNKEDENETE